MPRFIVKMNRDIVEEKRWRSGVLLVDRLFSATAVVKADEKAKRIYV
jgi:internalin A